MINTKSSVMANRPEYDAWSSHEFIKPIAKSNGLHQPSPLSYYPPIPNVPNNDCRVAVSTFSSCQICSSQCCTVSSNATPDWHRVSVEDYSEQINSEDITLNYIEQMLMQDTDDKVRSHDGESIALRSMEEPFYNLIGQEYPVLPELLPVCSCDRLNNISGSISMSSGQSCGACSLNIGLSNCPSNDNLHTFQAPWSLSAIVGELKQFTHVTERRNIGLNINGLSIRRNPISNDHSLQMNSNHRVSIQIRGTNECLSIEEFSLLEGQSNKHFAISFDEPIRNEMFDKVLLCSEHKPLDEGIILRKSMEEKSTKHSQNDQGRTSRVKSRHKRQPKKEVIDLRALLINCAQAVGVDNGRLASEILKKIRQHSSPSGDDTQRLAFYIADCLEVRLAGTGSQIYHKFIAKQRNAADILKLFRFCFTICPYLRASYYFSNKTILHVSKGKPRVHIIDFGIGFGFQWPSLFQQFANREGGPPKVRITGLELPLAGFRPDEMNKNTRLRLVDYANMFKVPFEYRLISSKWETISTEEFSIEKDEVLVVNCINRMKNLDDETISINSARNRVLNTIRMMKPDVFVQGVVSGSYSTPFFLSRYKEVMNHYTSLFDMLDRTTSRDNETRMILERDIYQCAILNAIACEGSKRIERPESYKTWKVRTLKASLKQLPLNPTIVKGTQDMVRKMYHKDFFADEEDQWLVLGWKGRILHALSTWKPESQMMAIKTEDIQ